MKNSKLRRAAALALIFGILLTGTAAASTLGDGIHSKSVALIDDTSLSNGVYWSTAYSDYRSENYIEYTPGGTVTPIVAYGSKVCNYGSFSAMAAVVEKRGVHVIAGINGDFYNTSNFQPLGVVITEGILRSSDGGFNAVGFYGDGTAIIGKPALTMTVTRESGNSYPIARFNKLRNGTEIVLFSSDFSYTTKNTSTGIDVILAPADPGFSGITIGSGTTFVVEEILESEGELSLPEGKYVISVPEGADEWRKNSVKDLAVGDTLTITVTSSDSRWNDVREAVGSYTKLVTDGAVESGLENGSGPRTAVGIKADGTVILYTIDGRQSGLSIGATLKQVAERLIELGCVEAGLMDGGGSTGLNAMYIGKSSLSQINSPSDGTARSVTNYIMLVSTAGATGDAYRLGLSPYDTVMLAGASKSFTASAADSAGYAVSVPRDLGYSVSGDIGAVTSGGVFTAGSESGKGTVEASSPGVISGVASVTVVKTPSSMTISNESAGKTVSSLSLSEGQSVNLTASAVYNRMSLISQDSCYIWSVTGGIGEIDSMGNFIATSSGSGAITVTAGDMTVSIPVSVGWVNPFEDVSKDDWYYGAVEYVYKNNLFQGTSATTFEPGTNMTRGMFVTVLGRLAGVDTGVYWDSPFEDVPGDTWYTPYVAWAYAAGITSGISDTEFAPDSLVTRQQVCTFLQRYLEYMGMTWEALGTEAFADDASISGWAYEAVYLMKQYGIVEGVGDNVFNPEGLATRAQVATILQRFSTSIQSGAFYGNPLADTASADDGDTSGDAAGDISGDVIGDTPEDVSESDSGGGLDDTDDIISDDTDEDTGGDTGNDTGDYGTSDY